MKTFTLKSGKRFKITDWNCDVILNYPELLSELDLKTLPEVMQSVLGMKITNLYAPIALKKLEMYDHSEEVNSFLYKGKKYWLDKQQRSCMKTVAESDLNEIEIVLGSEILIVSSEFVKQFILQLEAYAYKCFVVTAKHQKNIKELTNPEDIINYDYTTGYPDKIILE